MGLQPTTTGSQSWYLSQELKHLATIRRRYYPLAARTSARGDKPSSTEIEPTGAIEDSFARLDDTRFNLVVVAQSAPAAEATLGLGDLLRIHAIPDEAANNDELARAGIPRPSFYLLRPDGHVGLCGARLEAGAVGRYFAERLTLVSGER